MSCADLLALLVLVGLPALLFLRPLVRLFSRRDERGRQARGGGFLATIQEVATVASSSHSIQSVQSIQRLAVSVAVQIGVLIQARIEAIGYVVAQLRGIGGASMAQISGPGGIRHAVELDGDYHLAVLFQDEAPESYRGAQVDPQQQSPGMRLHVRVDGDGFEVSDGGIGTLEVTPAALTRVRFRIKPSAVGRQPLRVELYDANAWTQTIDLDVEVRSAAELARLQRGDGDAGALAETVEGSLTLAPAEPEPVPRDLHLSLAYAPGASPGATYRAFARALGDQGWRRLDMPLREHDLQELNQGLRETLEQTRLHYGHQVDCRSDRTAARGEVLDRLARRGNAAFLRLFPRADDRAYLVRALEASQPAHLEISTDALFLPWELLYDAYQPEQGADFRNFWGFRHHLSRVLTDVRQRRLPRLQVPAAPRLNLYANRDLPGVREEEVPSFHRLDRDGRIQLCEWQEAEAQDSVALRRERSRFLRHALDHACDVAHFACHAVAADYGPGSFLRLSPRLQVRIEDMEVETYRLAGEPLVVLNACGTGVRDPTKTSDFVRRFMLSGGRGVLATECDLPDRFGAAFVEHLYGRILEGERVTDALLAARRHFLEEYANPLGLLYSAYMPFETRLVGDRQARLATRP